MGMINDTNRINTLSVSLHYQTEVLLKGVKAPLYKVWEKKTATSEHTLLIKKFVTVVEADDPSVLPIMKVVLSVEEGDYK